MPHPTVSHLSSWPQPSTSPEASVFASETQLLIRYITDDTAIAVIQFPLVKTFQFGAPNDEALGGHPLAGLGLKHYQVHQVDNSPWIAQLEKQNSVHPRHEKNEFLKDLVHYIFTFQDATLECVVREGEFWKPQVQVFASSNEANAAWARLIGQVAL